MKGDQDIGIPIADGEWAGSGEGIAHREIGELLLHVDELEDTLHALGEYPGLREAVSPGARPDAIRRLEARIRTERAKIEELERHGPFRYDDIERAIRLSDRMG